MNKENLPLHLLLLPNHFLIFHLFFHLTLFFLLHYILSLFLSDLFLSFYLTILPPIADSLLSTWMIVSDQFVSSVAVNCCLMTISFPFSSFNPTIYILHCLLFSKNVSYWMRSFLVFPVIIFSVDISMVFQRLYFIAEAFLVLQSNCQFKFYLTLIYV